MKVPITEVTETILRVIKDKSSLTDKEARALANDYVEGELQGKKSHGLAAFVSLIPKLGDKVEAIEILRESDAALYIDAHSRYGVLVGPEVADLLLVKARKQGVSMASIKNMETWLRPGTVAQHVAEAGLIGLVTNTGSVPMVAPPGGYEPVVGTNPIGIGVPTATEPFIADMATSKRAWGEVRLGLATGMPLPDQAFLDNSGNITRDAARAYSALSFGEYKGFSLGLFIELLCGAFSGMPMGEGSVREDYRLRKRGANIIVIDPDFTVGKDKFATLAGDFMDNIRSTKPVPGAKAVTLPGDRSTKIKSQNLKSGFLDVDDAVWKEIAAVLGSA